MDVLVCLAKYTAINSIKHKTLVWYKYKILIFRCEFCGWCDALRKINWSIWLDIWVLQTCPIKLFLPLSFVKTSGYCCKQLTNNIDHKTILRTVLFSNNCLIWCNQKQNRINMNVRAEQQNVRVEQQHTSTNNLLPVL